MSGGQPKDPRAIGDGTIIGQLKRYTPNKSTQIAVQPMWGISRLRDTTTENNGATVSSDSGGELKLTTGSNSSGNCRLRTKQFGRYRSGDMVETGCAVRFTSDVSGGTSGQKIEWGPLTDNNGFGWGVDGSGLYVFRRSGTSDTTTRQSKWSEDPLDGTGPSGLDLDLSDGATFHVLYGWYGTRPIRFFAEVHDPELRLNRLVEVHRIRVTGSPSIEDPNLPIAVEADNDGTASSIDAFVGGRQFSLIGGGGSLSTRSVTAYAEGNPALTLSDDTWTEVVAVRRKSQLNSRENTITAFLKETTVVAGNRIIFRVEQDATIDSANSASWSTPDGWDASETAIETIRATDSGGLTVDTNGLPTVFGVAVGSTQQTTSQRRIEEAPLAKEAPLLLQAKRGTGTNTDLYLGALQIDEQH